MKVRSLTVLFLCSVFALPLYAQSVVLHERDAEVWAQEQVVTGTLDGATAGVLFQNDTPISFDVADGAFAVPVTLGEGVTTFVACTEDETVCSDAVEWTLGYTLRPDVFAYAMADGQRVMLHGEVLANPEDASLSFEWQADPGNPQSVMLNGTAGLTTSVTFADEAQPGEYYFDLLTTTSDGDEVRARTFVTVRDDGTIQPFDITEDHAAWIDKAVLYEVAPWYFGQYWPGDRLQMITEKIPELADLGITTLWLQPITESYGGGQGYDVMDYFKVWGEIGTEADLHMLVETAHDYGLKVILDFVPNHSSIHHRYAQDAIANGEASHYYDFYQRVKDQAPYSSNYTVTPAGEMTFITYFWDELVNFNYSNPEVEHFIIEATRHWIETFDIDGYRFDAVWAPHARDPEFTKRWRLALKRIKPELLMLAEAKAPRSEAYPTGFPDVFESFDVAYDWKDTDWCISYWAWAEECLYSAYESGTMSSLFNTGAPSLRAEKLRNALTNNGDGFPEGAKVLRFLENNDVPRFRTHHSLEATRMAAALLFSLDGIPMLYYGQESGITRQWPVIQPSRSLQSFDEEGFWPYYQHLMDLRASYPSLYSDNFEEVALSAERAGQIFAYHRWNSEEHIIGVANLGTKEVAAELVVPVDGIDIDPSTTYYLTNLLTGDYVETTGEGLGSVQVVVPGYTTALYVVADSIVQVNVSTATEQPDEVPERIALEQNYPNPFNPATTIAFALPTAETIRLRIFDMLGREVATLVEGRKLAGRHEVTFDASTLPSGVYLYRLEAGSRSETRRMLLVK